MCVCVYTCTRVCVCMYACTRVRVCEVCVHVYAGIADFDWSNVRGFWTRDRPMDDAARLAEQAAKVKQINPQTHVWVYRNLVKALSWYREVGEKLADPAYSGWFLPFHPGGAVDLGNNSWHSNPCTDGVCSSRYHSQDQTPRASECGGKCDCGGVPCGEYIWDHRCATTCHLLGHKI